MVSLDEGACIAYTATFNGEQDIYFVRAELPIVVRVIRVGGAARIAWNAVPGVAYCLQAKAGLDVAWSGATNVACLVATNATPIMDDPLAGGAGPKVSRAVRQP